MKDETEEEDQNLRTCSQNFLKAFSVFLEEILEIFNGVSIALALVRHRRHLRSTFVHEHGEE